MQVLISQSYILMQDKNKTADVELTSADNFLITTKYTCEP